MRAKVSPFLKNDRVLAGAIALLGLILRLLLWNTQPVVSADGTTYIRSAWSLGGGSPFDTVHPPGYPFLILAFHALAGDWILAARLVDFVAGVALVPLTWLLARGCVASKGLALAPALAVALMPLPVRYSLTTMSEAPYLALLLLAFVLVQRKRPLSGGFTGGLAYLVRPEALTAVLFLALLRLRTPKAALRVAAGAALVVSAFVAAQGLGTGEWSLSRKSVNVGGAEGWQNEPVAGKEGGNAPEGLGERVEAHGRENVAAYPRRIAALAEQALRHGGWIVPVAALLGLAGPGLLPGAGLVQFLLTPIFSLGANPRFILPFLPFLWVLAAAAVGRCRGALRWALGVACLAGLVASAFLERRAYTLNEDGDYPELVETGKWLRPHVRPGTVVYDRNPYAAFYAGASCRAIPLGEYDEALDAIVEGGGDFLVVSQAVVDVFRPSLLPLVLDKGVAGNEPRLKPVYINDDYKDRRVLVFRVDRPGGPGPLPGEEAIKKQLALLTHQETHYVHGILAMRGERWQVAAGEFAFVIVREPENADARNNRAWCLLQANFALGNAEEDARKAVELDPENLEYLDTLVAVLEAVGRAEEAGFYRARMDSLSARTGGS